MIIKVPIGTYIYIILHIIILVIYMFNCVAYIKKPGNVLVNLTTILFYRCMYIEFWSYILYHQWNGTKYVFAVEIMLIWYNARYSFVVPYNIEKTSNNVLLGLCITEMFENIFIIIILLLAPAVTVGETKGAMDSTSVFFWPLLLPITL